MIGFTAEYLGRNPSGALNAEKDDSGSTPCDADGHVGYGCSRISWM